MDILECEAAHKNFKRERKLSKDIPNCVWPFTIELPEPPPAKEIANYGLPYEQRKFPYLDLNKIREAISTDVGLAADIRAKEEEKRKNGFWFYNGYKLEYVTGLHYMFLQFWSVEGTVRTADGVAYKARRQPDFIDMQRDWHYCFDYILNSSVHLGLLYLGRRRTAKSEMALSAGYWLTTARESSRFAIQSKTEGDSEALMSRLVTSWKDMLYIWRPTDSGATDVKKRLEFKEPIRRSSKQPQHLRTYKRVLNSMIGTYSSTETALDGQYFSLIMNDEVFKTETGIANVEKRWYVNRRCLLDGTVVVGKAIVTSTVEEMDKSNLSVSLALWRNSKAESVNKNTGRTNTGLIALFFPAYYGFDGEYKGQKLIDEFGYSNMELAREYLLEERKGLTGNTLTEERRKSPFDEDDAFYISTNQEVFSQEALKSQNRVNIKNEIYGIGGDYQFPMMRLGNFYWTDHRFGNVGWRDDERGRWQRYMDAPDGVKNASRLAGGHKQPTGRYFFTGVDPVDAGGVRDGSGSMPVAYTIAKANPALHLKNDAPVCRYAFRHPDPHLFYEDVLMQSIYYSSLMLAEIQKGGINWWFYENGYDGYCMYDPLETDMKRKYKGDKGLSTSGKKTRSHMIRMGQTYVNTCVGHFEETGENGTFPFHELINDMLVFNPDKWTPHDDTVAFLVALVAAGDAAVMQTKREDLTRFLPT